jgi:hypothetical protein
MAQQPQATSQVVFGPVNQGGDAVHILNNANGLQGWVDKNNLTQGLSGVTSALVGGAPAAIAAAAASTAVFTSVLNLPGASAYEGIPFTIKASGWVTLNGGTYTASIQPLIYASTSLGFTASVAAAILSSAAVNVTIAVAAAATLTNVPWEGEVTVLGSTVNGTITGRMPAGAMIVGSSVPLPAAPAAIAAANAPTAVNFASATPLQFLVGVGILGATVSASNATLQSFFLES